MIKLIGFKIFGHSLFKDGTYFTLQTSGQITQKSKSRTIQFNNSLTLNRVIGIVGINATGKSTLMEIFDGLNLLYLLDMSIDQTHLNNRFRSKNNLITIDAYLATDANDSYVVKTTFKNTLIPDGIDNENNREWIISDEIVYHRKSKSVAKKDVFKLPKSSKDKNALTEIFNRKALNKDQKKLLSKKDSIFRAVGNFGRISTVSSTVPFTNRNSVISFMDSTPKELLDYLDNSIEDLVYEKDNTGKTIGYALKFKGSANTIHASSFDELSKYLSSGTIKGITLFYEFFTALRIGATLMVDEIELHINRQIVRDFIGFFTNPKVNVNNATLVYSSHYVELTDDLKRGDEEYILTRKDQTKLIRLNDAHVRTELKHSEIFQNNTLNGTAPSYGTYMKLMNAVKSHNPKFALSSRKATPQKIQE
ncbi:AAA family ATPase [Lentilactobacillus hilgardii]|uniref:AAA family ATPase n=1 Tax=Lentilactobacillus hilgardii TaxID=1588 RepID=UPI0021A2B004|nr:ATP-binding protein [Lentilactobacillus hilgardii]MCT3399058.1 ATP-binding protein [Lentilactobacillus hilgardii]